MIAMLGMIQRRKRPGLALESRQPLGILRKGFRQDFDRDVTTEVVVGRAIHLAHPAHAKWCANGVRA